jgi:hypothetical protein
MAVANAFSQLKPGKQILTSGQSVSRDDESRKLLKSLVIAPRCDGPNVHECLLKQPQKCSDRVEICFAFETFLDCGLNLRPDLRPTLSNGLFNRPCAVRQQSVVQTRTDREEVDQSFETLAQYSSSRQRVVSLVEGLAEK